MNRILLIVTLAVCACAGAFGQNTPRGPVTKNTNTHDIIEDLRFGSGRTLTMLAGSTLTLSGTLTGTPSGGTLNLSNVTLTLGSPTVTGEYVGTGGAKFGTGSLSLVSAGEARVTGHATGGAVVMGNGSTDDFTVLGKTGATVMRNPTGTSNLVLVGNLTVSGTGASTFGGALNASGNVRSSLYLQGFGGLIYKSGGVGTAASLRWAFEPTGAESSGNAGSDLAVYRYDDAGAYLSTVLTLTRSSGLATLGGDVNVGSVSAYDPVGYSGRVLNVAGSLNGAVQVGASTADADATTYGDFSVMNYGTTSTEKRLVTIRGMTNGTTANERGGKMVFYVKNNGAATISEAMSLAATGASVGGTTTNDNAATGKIGEYLSSTVAHSVSLTTGTAANITSISLTSGDWDVEGVVDYNCTGVTATFFTQSPSSTSATLGALGAYSKAPVSVSSFSDNVAFTFPRARFSVTATTTIYLVGRAHFSAGTVSAGGTIHARRVR